MEHIISETEPEIFGDLDARYAKHVAALESCHERMRAWHVAAARGLYRMMADRECDGGAPAPMGMPHLLCVSDAEVQMMVAIGRKGSLLRELRK